MTAVPHPDSSAALSLVSPARPQTDRDARVAAVAALGARQDGVVARRQLREHGWTDHQVDHEIRFGRWHVPGSGIVAMQNSSLTSQQRLWLGVLHGGPAAVLTHLSAVRAAGLRWTGDEDTVHVLTPKGDLIEPLPGFVFHQTRRPYAQWGRAGGSGPPRLPLEYAALLTAERDRSLRRAIGLLAACVQQGLTTADRLLLATPRIRKLRHGEHFVLALGNIAGGAQSFAEIDLGRLCREAGLAAPARQAIRLDGTRRRYLDCEWVLPGGRVIVLEIDGSFHLQVGTWWQDMRRERAVVLSRSVVLRCSSIELRLEPEAITSDLRAAGVPAIRLSR